MEIGAFIGLAAVNVAMLGLIFRVFQRGEKPTVTVANGNPGRGIDPDDVPISRVSIGYMERRQEEVLNKSLEGCQRACSQRMTHAVTDGMKEGLKDGLKPIVEALQKGGAT